MATTTRVMTTVLPYSVDPNGTFHVSVLFSHRLAGSAKLSDYPAMVNWVTSLTAPTTKFSLRIDNGETVGCTPLFGATDKSVWANAFPAATTAVADFPNPTVTQNEWKSYHATARLTTPSTHTMPHPAHRRSAARRSPPPRWQQSCWPPSVKSKA